MLNVTTYDNNEEKCMVVYMPVVGFGRVIDSGVFYKAGLDRKIWQYFAVMTAILLHYVL
ncbi:hypothetical protein SANA_10870 [Gottschalkiaceae bacterium SANA]|nr:hypothetical protein SANA_10870 [Gottschalkiaceae bacterium SANA]